MKDWKCGGCGRVVPGIQPGTTVTCRCGFIERGNPAEYVETINGRRVPPSVLRKGLNFVQAWGRWTLSGRPKRSKSEVAKLRVICSECDLFDGHICTHGECGCSVVEPSVFGDKLLMKTEHCPIGKW